MSDKATESQQKAPRSVLFLCTANSARSQMAEALTRHIASGALDVHSSGTHPGPQVHPMAVTVLAEIGLSASDQTPKSMDELPRDDFDWVITVCDQANDECPLWPGSTTRLHWSVEDPAAVTETEEQTRETFRSARDELQGRIEEWLQAEAII